MLTLLYQLLAAFTFWAALAGLVLACAVLCAAMVFWIFEPMGGDDA